MQHRCIVQHKCTDAWVHGCGCTGVWVHRFSIDTRMCGCSMDAAGIHGCVGTAWIQHKCSIDAQMQHRCTNAAWMQPGCSTNEQVNRCTDEQVQPGCMNVLVNG